MTMTKQAPTLADLEAQKAAADQEASKVATQIAEARRRADEAQAQIQAIHRARIEQWAQGVVDGDREARRNAMAAITEARQAFHDAVAAGSPEFLARWLDLVRRQSEYRALNTRLQSAHYELDMHGAQLPDLGRDGQVGDFLDAFKSPVARAASNIISDAEDQAHHEYTAVRTGELEDGEHGR